MIADVEKRYKFGFVVECPHCRQELVKELRERNFRFALYGKNIYGNEDVYQYMEQFGFYHEEEGDQDV